MATAAVLASVQSASAAPVHLQITGAYDGGVDIGSFNFGISGEFAVFDYVKGTGAFDSGSLVAYNKNQVTLPGLALRLNDNTSGAFGYFGSPRQLYLGPETSPTLLNGTYVLQTMFGSAPPPGIVVTISGGAPGAPVPDLGGGTLAGLATLGMLALHRGRRRNSGTRAWREGAGRDRYFPDFISS